MDLMRNPLSVDTPLSRIMMKVFISMFAVLYILTLLRGSICTNKLRDLVICISAGGEIIVLAIFGNRLPPVWKCFPLIQYSIYCSISMILSFHNGTYGSNLYAVCWMLIDFLIIFSCFTAISDCCIEDNCRRSIFLYATMLCFLFVLVFDFVFLDAYIQGYSSLHIGNDPISGALFFIAILMLLVSDRIIFNIARIARLSLMLAVSSMLYFFTIQILSSLDTEQLSIKSNCFMAVALAILSLASCQATRKYHHLIRTRKRKREEIIQRMTIYSEDSSTAKQHWILEKGLMRDYISEYKYHWFIVVYQAKTISKIQKRLIRIKKTIQELHDNNSHKDFQLNLLEREAKDLLGYLAINYHFETGYYSTSLDLCCEEDIIV